MIALVQRTGNKLPAAIGAHGHRTDRRRAVAIVDSDDTARCGAAGELRRSVVGRAIGGNRHQRAAIVIAQHHVHWRCRWREINGEGVRRGLRPDVACRIGDAGRQAVTARFQDGIWREAPAAVIAGGSRADDHAVIAHDHHAVRLGATAQHWCGVVGRPARGHRYGRINLIVHQQQAGRLSRCRGIHGKINRRGRCANVARRAGNRRGQAMFALAQRRYRIGPCATGTHQHAAQHRVAIEDGDGTAGIGGAAQLRRGVVGRGAAVNRLQRLAVIVVQHDINGGRRRGEIDCEIKRIRRRPAVARRVGDNGGQAMRARLQCRIRREAPVAVCIGLRRANHAAIVVNRDEAARLRAAAEQRRGVISDAIRRDRQRRCALIVNQQQVCGGRRIGEIDVHLQRGRRCTGIASRTGFGRRQAVLPLAQRGGWREAPAAVVVDCGGAQHGIAIRDGDGAAGGAAAAQDRRGVVSGTAGDQHRRAALIITELHIARRGWRGGIDGKAEGGRGFAGIASGIGHRRRQAMVARCQHRCGEAPAAVVTDGGGAQYRIAIGNGHGAARFRAATEHRRGVIGEAIADRHRCTALVVAEQQLAGHSRGAGIDDDNHRRAARPGIARRVGNGGRQVVLPFAQRIGRGEAPAAVAACRRRAQHRIAVADGHRAARFSGTAQGWRGVIGAAARGNRCAVAIAELQIACRRRCLRIDGDGYRC